MSSSICNKKRRQLIYTRFHTTSAPEDLAGRLETPRFGDTHIMLTQAVRNTYTTKKQMGKDCFVLPT